MKPRVWVEAELHPEALARLQAATETVLSADPRDLYDSDAMIISASVWANGPFMDRAGPRLKVIARPGIGVDNVDLEAASERGIVVINTPSAPTESTAEHTVALILALTKRIVAGDMSMRSGLSIDRWELLGTEIYGRTLGIIGCGRIGRRVAEICHFGLRMTVLGYDEYVTADEVAPSGIELLPDLDMVLTRADVLTLHTPYTPETHHMIDEAALRRMKPGAYLINASRGPVVVEQDLAHVLFDGHLAGAALDVFDPEPPPRNHPLFMLHNVVVTPHISSYTDRGMVLMGSGVVDQVLQVLRGERPPNLVNPEGWPGRAA